MPFRILISDSLSKEAVEILEKEKEFSVDVNTKLTPEELEKIIKDYDALLVRSATKVTEDVIGAASKLKIIGRAGVGLDNVDVDAASKKGIIVVNTPGGNTISTAEHTFSMMLALSRNIPQADLSMKRGEWERKKFMGSELYGKVLGIFGLGRIGAEVAKRALSFEMKVIAYDPYLSADKAKVLGIELADMKTILKESDYITVHTPLTDETKHMIADKEFALMKKGVKVINCARGGIIDEDALAKAIESGKVAGAAFDVYEEEPPKGSRLLKLEKVVLTPHLGASTEEAQANVAVDVANTVRDALLNRGVRNAVNMPYVDPEVYKTIEPYLKLAEKIGSIHAQLAEGHIRRVKIRYVGDILKYDLSPFTVSIMKGMLTPILQETVNFVNSLVIAKERGINIIETKTAEVQDFANLIHVEVETDKSKSSLTGTLFTKVDPRIVKINEFYVDAVPEGYMLFISNKDVPGIIGQIGTILGKNTINIAGMSFGRDEKGGRAVSVLNIDSDVPKDILAEIRKAANIY
ncbi:MAG: phosphoglycerate dehydrogenase, partial [Candidatus Omnitrophota bacterium]|nr:phosphoglycerate dehydrogenase [Candidatus Omnitrophota bacterium]